jgi:hypothetical protein
LSHDLQVPSKKIVHEGGVSALAGGMQHAEAFRELCREKRLAAPSIARRPCGCKPMKSSVTTCRQATHMSSHSACQVLSWQSDYLMEGLLVEVKEKDNGPADEPREVIKRPGNKRLLADEEAVHMPKVKRGGYSGKKKVKSLCHRQLFI